MSNIFKEVQFKKQKRSTFNLNHDRKMSCDMGRLIPVMCQEVVPGDSFNVVSEQMLRMAPMLAPVMHRVNVYTHFFFVPNRILWPNWEQFITGGEDGTAVPVHPYINPETIANGSIGDYMGLPTFDASPTPADNSRINALPFAAYTKIFNEYYRDQNLQTALPDTLVDGDNSVQFNPVAEGDPIPRAWEHDYFTSALPFAQKGDAVTIPIAGEADVNFQVGEFDEPAIVRNPVTGAIVDNADPLNSGNAQGYLENGTNSVTIDNSANLVVDLTGATASTINDLRRAFKLQEWLELNARGGSRYIENIFAHFGVKSSDARLQRPEYLGGGKSPIVISEVLQYSETTGDNTPQGNMAGHGINVGATHQFKRFFEEHGFIIGIMSIMPVTAYQQGLPRMFSRPTKLDYYWPSFAHIGEQEILNKELYYDPTVDPEANDEVFGYTPRYSEYKYQPSTVHGDFRTNLAFWHMGRIFENRPLLNAQFIASDPTKRIFAVVDENQHSLWCHVFMRVKATRPMPYFGNPQI